ncbi:MAG: hypothetical protein JKY37_21080, partial [Nannocystaceae bacterium]|nr:hypothetical protein [Nannocystaceae bacterium]
VKLAGGAKGDRLSIKVPKGFTADFGAAATMFVKKGSLHVTTLVQGGVAVVAIGSGGRDLVAKVATGLVKPPRTSLAQDVGLKSIRAAMGGCQLCVSGGANEYLRFRLLLTRDGAENKAASMAAATWLRALSKISDLGAMGAGVKVEKNSASFGAVLPQSLLYADRKKIEQLLSMSKFVADPEASIEKAR